jgi:hypothetical protein
MVMKRVLFVCVLACLVGVLCCGIACATELELSIKSSATGLPIAGSFEITLEEQTIIVAGAYSQGLLLNQ